MIFYQIKSQFWEYVSIKQSIICTNNENAYYIVNKG
jgi:hypothetical protein